MSIHGSQLALLGLEDLVLCLANAEGRCMLVSMRVDLTERVA